MITCALNNQKYTIDFVSGRALREMEPAAKMYGRIVALSNAALKGTVSAFCSGTSSPRTMCWITTPWIV